MLFLPGFPDGVLGAAYSVPYLPAAFSAAPSGWVLASPLTLRTVSLTVPFI